MRIIREGKIPEEELYQKICGNCKTLFEFARKEVTYQGSHYNQSYYVVKCPFCHKTVTFEKF